MASSGAPGLPALPPDSFGLLLDGTGVVAASRSARRALGAAGEEGAPLAFLLESLRADDAALAEAAAALSARGAAFRLRARLARVGVVEATGAPQGAYCLLVFRDASAEADAEAALAARLDAAEAEASALRAALEFAGVAAWRRDAGGRVMWRTGPPEKSDAAPDPDAPASRAFPLPDGGAVALDAAGPTASEAALRRFAETVTETFAHLRTGLAIFDAERRLMLSNPALAEIFGAELRWLAGRPTLRETLDRLREARRLPDQADYPAWRARLFTLFDDPSKASYEDVWALPDGRSVHVIGRPHPMGGIAFVFEDVTEAVALQRWRTTAVEVRRATLDMLGDGVAVFGPDGMTRMSNPAFRDMWALGEDGDGMAHVADLSARCGALCVEGDVWARMRAAVAGGGGRAPWRGRARLADGRVLDGRIAPMPDGSTLVAFSDVTDSDRIATALRERAAALEAAEEMRNALVDQLSHRLRTPLTAIFGFGQMLAEGRAGALTDAQAGYVGNIQNAARLLLDSVENLADLASMQAGDLALATGDVAMAPALTGAIGLLERRLLERGARIELGPVAAEALARGDPARLRQMIFNLLVDAVGRAREGETLRVGLDQDDAAVTLWCLGGEAATGSLAHTLARRAAELHGGSVALDAGPEGALVTCRLPRARCVDAAE